MTLSQQKLFTSFECANPSDIVYTPEYVADDMVRYFKPSGKCLDPCKGDGVFLKLLPPGSDYCEIREGKDFFDYKEKVDWIVSNPPYSIFVDWLRHSFEISDNVAYIVPTNKIFQSFKIMDQIKEYGGIHTILVYGGGGNVGFPFGFSVGAFYFKRHYSGLVTLDFRRPNPAINRT